MGVKQNACFYWNPWDDGSASLQKMMTSDLGDTHENAVSAFTVSELGEMLPDFYCSYKYNLPGSKSTLYECVDIRITEDTLGKGELALTEADARAKCLIYLLENGLVTL